MPSWQQFAPATDIKPAIEYPEEVLDVKLEEEVEDFRDISPMSQQEHAYTGRQYCAEAETEISSSGQPRSVLTNRD